MPSCKIPLEAILKAKLIDFLVEIGLQSSKGEARRLIRNGGVYINNEKVGDENCVIDCNLLIDGRLMLLAAGKKNKMLVRITDE